MKSEDAPSVAQVSQPTPPQEETTNNRFASYVPHDLKYDSAFEDSLIKVVLEGSATTNLENSVRLEDVSPDSLPVVTEDDLPLPLSDDRRSFPSPISGIQLTHPGGYIEGGPGLDPEMDTFVEDFIERNPDISSQSSEAVLRQAVQREVEQNLETLKERLRARRKAHERNEQIDKELKMMRDQHSMEMKINRKLADERRAKKEAKERKRRGER